MSRSGPSVVSTVVAFLRRDGAVLMSGAIGGVLGLLLAIPSIACATVLVEEL
ncbi:MAG: hypothetical protein H0W13_01990 [Nitrospirales bacterium]|nr:hypothetical protein [Nitrospirales bacterium]